jgi:pimeloyl-ACP methyl ester carboxylesterase
MSDSTVVLIHGAFADAAGWRALVEELGSDAKAILAPPNPLRGTISDGAYMKNFVEQIDGDVLLVGHSYGGAVATVAGTAENVVGLVYVAGFCPDEGEPIGAMVERFDDARAAPHLTPAPLPEGGAEVAIDPAAFHEVFCADLPAEDAAFMAISQRPLSVAAFSDAAPAAAWKTKPSWAILPTEDGAIHPDLHRWAFDRAGSKVTVVDGASHAVFMSQPKVVADVIREALAA